MSWTLLPPWQVPTKIVVVDYTIDPSPCPLCGGEGTYADARGRAKACDWPPCEASRGAGR